ncbi:MAG TPA: energy-coupling factor transporter transmembrane component T [Candidatus Binatia bacterium]|jgi:cobalt/nickel transport system permease protein|nr:energy-coupling factor transporter transmembrane component T [Candidatus Binatia bacterium]
MHVQKLEARRRTLVSGAWPRLKLVGALVIITGTALLPRRIGALYLLPTIALMVLWPLSRMPLGYTLRRLVVVEVFILGIALLSLVTPSAAPVFFSALAKSNLCIFTMLLLTWTTPFHEILEELRRLRLPSVMLTTLALMYRYLPVLAEESRRMQRARASRTFRRRNRLAWHNLTTIIGQLFVRSAERAERIYLAMCSRGWK